MNLQELTELLDRPSSHATLSTCDSEGNPNSALFGSLRITDGNRVVLGLGDNRTLQNLSVNPHGAILVFEPGDSLPAWRGARLYVEVVSIERSGALLDGMIQDITKAAGRAAGRMIKAAVTFRITHSRPLIDFGR